MTKNLLRTQRATLSRTAWLLGVLCWLGFGTGAWAQVNAYTFAQSTGTYTPITGGTVYGNNASDDQSFVDPALPLGTTGGPSGVGIPIGFNFTYNGVVFDRIGINNNGWITFGQSTLGAGAVNTNTSDSYTGISATSTAPTLLQQRVAVFSTDLRADADASLRVEIIGTAPNRTCVIQWASYPRYVATQVPENFNFQIRLNETTNVIDLVYGDMIVNNTSTTAATTAQVGLRGHSNVDYNNRSTATNWNTSVAGIANNSTCTSSNTAIYPVSGLTFTYTPPVCSAPIITSITPLNNLAAITWNPVASATGGYNVQYRVGTSGPFTSFVGNPVAFGTNSATLTGLLASTSYEVQVQSDCAPAGVFSVSYTFSTGANPVAPTFAYICTQSLGTYTEITGGTVLGTTANNAQVFNNSTTGATGPVTSTGFPIGFNFNYRGLTLDKFAVATDGFIVLGTGTFPIGAVTTTPLSTSSANYTNALSIFGVNMEGQAGSELSYATIGVSPNQTLVVQWKGYRRSASTGDNFNMQIRLNEADNSVEYVYGNFASGALTTTTFQVGLREVGTNTTVFTSVLNRILQQGWAATTIGTSNTSTSGFSQGLVPASGTTLKFVSSLCAVPTSAPTLVGATGLTTASIAWSASAVATDGYDIRYRRSMDPFNTYTVVNVPGQLTSTANLTGLQQGMQYVVEVRNRCSTSTFSEYSPALTLSTQNNPLNYVFSQGSTTYTEITGGFVLGGTSNDSESFSGTLGGSTSTFSGYGFPINFPFTFNGNVFERFAVSTNGWINLGTANGSFQVGNSTSPLASTIPHTAIAGFAADLFGQTGSEIRYETIGTAPNRTLVVQWKNYRRSGSTGESMNFQIRLNETTNTVDIVYGAFTLPTGTSTVGLVGLKTNGTTAHLNTHTRTTFIGAGQSWLNTSTGNANNSAVAYANMSSLNTSFPTNGLRYTFTPNNCVPFPTLAAFGATPPNGTLIVNWTTVAGATNGYDIRYRRYGDLPAAYTVVNIPSQSTNTFNLTGLVAGEPYIIEIRSRCSASSFSEYSNGSVGITNCSPISAARNYDFNLFLTPTLPSCWSSLVVLGTSTTAAVRTTTSGTPVSGNQLELINGTTTDPSIRVIAIMPQMSDLGAGQSRRVRFRARSGTAGTILKVGTMTSATDANSYTNTIDIALTTTHTEYIVPFDVYTGGNQFVAFRHGAEGTNTNVSAFIDDVVWEVIPPCGAPAGIAISNILSTSATVSWNLGLGDFAGYELQYRTGTGAWTTVVLGTGVLTTNLTGLLANTPYEVQIRTMCNGLQSTYSSIVTFTTPCASVALPYFEGFESVTVAGAQVPCHVRNGDWTTQIGSQDFGRLPRTGTKYAHTSWATIAGGDMYYFAPVTLTGGASYKTSIWYNTGTTDTGWSEFSILYGTSQTDAGLVNIASAVQDGDGDIITTGYQELTGTFTAPTTGVYYIALRVVGDGVPWYFMVDDFSLEQLFAIDAKPTVLVTPTNVGCLNSAAQSIVVQIQNNGTAALNFATNNLTVTTNVTGATTATLTGTVNTGTLASGATLNVTMASTLNMSTTGTYNFSVTSNLVGDLAPGNNTASVGSRTNVAPVALPQNVNFTGFDGNNMTTVFPNWYEASGDPTPTPAATNWSSFTNTTASPNLGANGNVLARINYYGNALVQGQHWFVGPKITATATTTLKFSTAATAWNTAINPTTVGDDDGIQIMVSTDCGATWVVANSFLGTTNFTTTLTEKTVLLAAYNGQQILVAVRGTTGATLDTTPDYWLWLDDIRVYDAAPIDMAATALVSPATAGCYGANQTVTVKVRNFGALPMNFATNPTTVTVDVTGAATQTLTATLNTGTLAVDATQDVVVSTTFNMSAFGTYTFNANTAVTVGVDGDATNNAMAATTRVITTPLTVPLTVVDYTGFDGANLTTVFPNWNEAQGITTPAGTTSNWSSFTSTALTPNMGVEGNVVARVNYWALAQTHDWFVGPKFTATANTEFVFKVAATQYNFSTPTVDAVIDADDELRVRISTDCGSTWTTLQAYGATSGLTATLTEKVIPLGAYAGQNIILAIQGTIGAGFTAGDYFFFVDDLAVKNCIPPTVTTQPAASATICAGASTSFTVAAAGDGLTYQWQVNTGSGFANIANGVNYSDVTTATLNILAAPVTFNTYLYRVVITGRCGNITSSSSTLNVQTAPNITTQPTAQVSCIGASVTFNVVATGAGLTYQWRKGGTPIGGAISASITISPVNAGDAGSYDCVVSGTCTPSATSSAVNLTLSTLAFVNATAPNGVMGVAYTFDASITGNTAPVTYSVSPALPAGLSLNTTTGAITGTPTATTASATYTVTANQAGPCSVTQAYTFSVGCPTLTFNATTASAATVGTPYSINAGATGTGLTITYSVSPALPAGLTLDTATGAISGTPTASAASATYTVTASYAGPCTAAQAYIFAVTCPAIVFTNTAPNNGTVGVAYTLNAGVTGSTTAITYSVSPALPAGLTLNTTTGAITGTPTATTASATYTVTASQTGCSVTQAYTFSVGCPTLTFNATTASVATVGTPYSINAGATGTGLTITYSVSPALPAGLTLNTGTGAISGTPTTVTASATYTVTASYAGPCTATQAYTFAVGCPTITFTNTTPTNATVGASYTLNASVTGTTTTPVTYSVSPALPAGLSLNTSTGIISGTATSSVVSTTYTVTASQSGPCSVTQAYTFAAVCSNIVFTNTIAMNATVNVAYNLNAAVTGNTATITYSVSPALPAGLTLSTTLGTISGTPTAPVASTTYTVTATQVGCVATQTYTFAVNCPAIVFTVTTAPAGTVGTAYSLNAGVTGGNATITYSVSPALPAGLTLNTATGMITGTPTATAASTAYTVTASQSGPCTATRVYTFAVTCPAIVFGVTTAPPATVGTAYSLNASVTGNTTPITYSVSPALPAGLTLSTTTGAISGTPTAPTASATYTVTASQTGCSATQAYTFAVGCPTLVFNATIAPAATVGTAYSVNAGVTGSTTTVTYSVSPALPAGLTLNTGTGAITGTPTATAASATYTVTASQSGPCTATQAYTFAVTCPTITFTVASASNAVVGTAYSLNAGVTGNTTPITYSVSPALPAGLTLSTTTGMITGTPTGVVASTGYVVTASQTGCSATRTFTFAVGCPTLVFNATTAPAATVGTAYSVNAGVTGSTNTVTYSVSPALPAGLTLNTTTGLISGTPTATVTSTAYTVTASQSGPCSATQIYTFAVTCPAIVFTNTSALVGFVSAPYNLNASVTGNTTTITYSVSPALPAGLTLNTSTGAISGTPTAITASATYTVTASQTGCSATQAYTFAVECATITITTQPTSVLIKGGTNANFTVAGTSVLGLTYQWQENGSNINNGGVYSGATSATLTITGATASLNNNTYRCVVRNVCRNETSSSAILNINVIPSFNTVAITDVLEDSGARTINNWATGIVGPLPLENSQVLAYQMGTITNGAMFSVQPAVSATGTLTYTPATNANGTATFQVRASDGVDESAYQTFTINVTPVNDEPSFAAPVANTEQVAGSTVAVNLSGFAPGGGADEASQTFSVTAVAVTGASVVELPTSITVTGTTATFNMKLLTAGEATIRVILRDNGGVLNGGDDSVERIFSIRSNAQQMVYLPSRFSPNDDKTNDNFRVVAAKGSIQSLKLEVFDARGNLVYFSDVIDKIIDEGWDGKFNNAEQPQGVYGWRLSGKFTDGRDIKAEDGKNININTGTIKLVRGVTKK